MVRSIQRGATYSHIDGKWISYSLIPLISKTSEQLHLEEGSSIVFFMAKSHEKPFFALSLAKDMQLEASLSSENGKLTLGVVS